MPSNRRPRISGRVAALLIAGASAVLGIGAPAATAAPAAPAASAASSPHTGFAYSPYSNYTMKWTRADAMKIKESSNPFVAPGQNSMPAAQTMPDIPADFPVMTDQNGKQVWVWDTWPLTDDHGNQYSYKGWTVIFSLVADPYAGYTFDDRHVHARIGFWYHKASQEKSPWIYGGHLFGNVTPDTEAEWSGSTRIFGDGSVKVFYTHLNFADRSKPQATLTEVDGQLNANSQGVWFSGLNNQVPLLRPDGKYYQTNTQNPYFSFRDPFTFTDPANPGKTFMVFEGNTAGIRGAYQCKQSDLGDDGENPKAVTASGANYQMANIGLAVADNTALTKWHFLPPLLSGNCVNDQTERPEMVIKQVNGQWRYYLFTISHAFTYAAGLSGPDGVYGFVGDGIRSDFIPMNGSGLVLGNPTDLNLAPTDPQQNPRHYQAYSHYVMPGGLVESFIDNVEGRRGGTLAPTVKVDLGETTSTVNHKIGDHGLLGYGYIPANLNIDPGGPSGQAKITRNPG